MIRRFSAYGFLKNQRYFEPFLVLFFVERGLSFTQIGVIIAFQALCVNVAEIPSGAVADVYGRRRSMIVSFVSYIVSFVIFALALVYWHFFVAVLFFAVGEAFRTGTHKAMIFTWLRLQGRIDERTRVYGFTRSWSKIGSAFSIVLATVIVLVSGSYRWIFWCSIPPYLLAVVNFLGYPCELDGRECEDPSRGTPSESPKSVVRHLRETFRAVVKNRSLRHLIEETMVFEGVFAATKDYIQPLLEAMALTLPILVGTHGESRTAIVVGAVYFVLYIASAVASRRSHLVTELAGGAERAAQWLWTAVAALFIAMSIFFWIDRRGAVIVVFVLLYVIQNYWRPNHISRFDDHSDEAHGATVLSIESQAKAVATMVIAPTVGVLVDWARTTELGGAFWPVGVVGMILTVAMATRVGGRG